MTNEGPLWGQLLSFQIGIHPREMSALLSAFTLRMAHFVFAFTECVLTIGFAYAFTPEFPSSSTIDLLGWISFMLAAVLCMYHGELAPTH